jgi:hypothetical protein
MQRKIGAQGSPAGSKGSSFALQGLQAGMLATMVLGAGDAAATEGGGNSNPVGVETNFNGVMLPEGLHYFVYYSHYSAGHFKDNGGDDNRQFAHFALRSNAAAARLSIVWPGLRIVGATVETRLVQPVVALDLELAVATPGGRVDRSGSKNGLADLSFTPIILGWHGPDYHQTLGLDGHLKDGSYTLQDRVNTGRNYNQVAPFYALTWFPGAHTDVNAKFRYGFNGRNKDTGYQSGNEATIEFSAGYRPAPALAFGLNGYVYRQTTDDELHGLAVNGNGNRGRVNALGPYISYSFTPRVTLIAKLQSEFGARNRPQGTRLWSQMRIPF